MKMRGFLSFVAFAVMIVSSLYYFGSMGVPLQSSKHRTRMSMEIPDVNGLVAGSRVLLRGVPIGEVTGVSTTVAAATVDFDIDDPYAIPVDSDVRLENLSALGETYIGFVPRTASGPMLQNGQRIATAAVTQPPSISELATTVARVMDQLDPNALKRIIDEADVALPDPTATLPNLSRTSVLLRNAAANMNGNGRILLDNFQVLLRNANFVGPVLAYNADYLRKMASRIRGVSQGFIRLWRAGGSPMVETFNHLLARVEHFLDHSGGDLKVLTQTLLPYENDIAAALMNLDTGQVFGNLLAAVPEDGAVTLHVTIPGR